MCERYTEILYKIYFLWILGEKKTSNLELFGMELMVDKQNDQELCLNVTFWRCITVTSLVV